ncbi:MAG: hypothetical protein M1821_002268 [Bathelium mastoideum]|nr:MAG: hypothetical protein M1821_002268 [Bathelium mastoideum]
MTSERVIPHAYMPGALLFMGIETVRASELRGLPTFPCLSLLLTKIPGHFFPPIIWSLLAVYLVSFGISFATTSPYEVLADELDIITTETGDPDDVPSDVEEEAKANGNKETPIEELDVQETVVFEEKQPHALFTVLSGLPSPGSMLWSAITVAINLLLTGMVTDLVYNAPYLHQANDLSFARLGFVSDTSANILVREPRGTELPIWISYRDEDAREVQNAALRPPDDAWKSAGQISWLSEDTDYTAAIMIKGLKPDTTYRYALSNNHSDSFTTAPRAGETSRHNQGSFVFFHSSCIKPHFPYNPFSHPLSVPGFQAVAAVKDFFRAQFMLFLGDFIYIDVPRRLGDSPETYRREYRQVYASPDWGDASRGLPWIHVLDDHEIANDWDQNVTAPYPAAVDPWHHYHTSVNPPAVRKDTTYFSFTQGPASFFLLDTRRYRSPITSANATDPGKSMLGQDQLNDLLHWLRATPTPGVRWKFVVSSVPFTRNWRLNSGDTWAGYLVERQRILEAMWDVGASSQGVGVVVLSGDRHEFAATELVPPEGGKWPVQASATEFSCSPLNMFWLPWRTYWEYPSVPSHGDNGVVQGEDRLIKLVVPVDVSFKYVADASKRYHPRGNSKFGAIELSTPVKSDQSVLRYRLFVNGRVTWSYLLQSPAKGSVVGRAKDAVWG